MVIQRNQGKEQDEFLQNRFRAYLFSAVQRRRAQYIDEEVKAQMISSLMEERAMDNTGAVLQRGCCNLLPCDPEGQKENEGGIAMTFRDILIRAKLGDESARLILLAQYKPILIKGSIRNGRFDEDLYQEQCLVLMKAINQFII